MESHTANTSDIAGNHISIEMQNVAKGKEQIFKQLSKLILNTTSDCGGEEGFSQNLYKVRDIVNENANSIYETSIKGRNIFHVLATQPEKNLEILKIFGFDIDNGRHTLENISQQKLEQLLYMPYGARDDGTPVHLAVDAGFTEFVKLMLDTFPSLLSAKDKFGNTPIHLAAKSSSPEAVECLECMLNVVVRNDLTEEILMRTWNARGATPIHTLCSKVPKNLSANVSAKLGMLLFHDCTRDILREAGTHPEGNSSMNPLHLLCCKDEQSQDCIKNGNIRALLEGLIQHRQGINEKTQDAHRRTALHLAAISELPELVEVLVNHSETDVTIKDAHGKMAIHYVAANSIRPRSQDCFKILSNWSILKESMRRGSVEAQDSFRNYLLWEAYEHAGSKHTALTLACQAKSTKTVEYILKNVFQAKSNFGVWFMGKEHDQEIYSLKQVYKHTPAVLEFLFDKSIRIDMENSNERRVEFTTDISVITALGKPLSEDKTVSEMEYLGYAKYWPEEIQETLLLHPLTQCTLYAIWEKMILYKMFWFLVNLIWLLLYFLFVPYKYNPEDRTPEDPSTHQFFAAWILGVFCVLYAVNELLALGSCKRNQFHLEMNVLSWLQIILTMCAIYGPCLESLGATTDLLPHIIEDYCAGGGVLLAFLIFWRNIGIIYLPFGIQVEYLIQTIKKILVALLCCAPIIIGFERAFRQMLPECYTAASIWTFTKTLVMMTGEFEYDDMYQNYKSADDTDFHANSTRAALMYGAFKAFHSFKLLTFIVFLILLPVAFYNLVTGIVVDKIKSMENKLQMYQIFNHIRLINYVQRTMVLKMACLSTYLPFIQPFYIAYRCTPEGEVALNQEVHWYVEKDFRHSWWSSLSQRFFPRTNDGQSKEILCSNFLPDSVKQHIFSMYDTLIELDDTKRNY